MTRKRIAIWSSVLAVVILLAGAVGVSESNRQGSHPSVTVPDAEISQPEPEVSITADPEATLPPEADPIVGTQPAPLNIPQQVYTQGPVITPVFPRPESRPPVGSAPPPVNIPAPVIPPVLPPVEPILPIPVPVDPNPILEPLKPIVEPLAPITNPLLETVDNVLPNTKLDIEVGTRWNIK